MGPSRGGEFAGKWSISRVAARIIAELGYCERSFNTRMPGVVMKAKPRGMLWMMPAAWRNLLPGALWRAPRALLEGRLVARTSKFTLLDDAMRGSGDAAAGSWVGKAGRRQRLAMVCDRGGKRRLLFGIGEGPAEAAAGAKQVSMGVKRKQFVKKFVSEQWILSCKSLGRPLAYRL
jgi:hypothetical protein